MLPSEQETKIVKDKTFTEPYQEKMDVIYNPEVMVSQRPYILDRADFIILMSGDSKLSQWATNILFAGLAFVFTVVTKYLQLFINKESKIEFWELLAVGITLGLALILYVADKYWPNERSELIRKMKEHFVSSSKSVEYRKRK